MKTLFNKWRVLAASTALVFAVCCFYAVSIPVSSSWLHEEIFDSTAFDLGTIGFLFYDTELNETSLRYQLALNAPTRYFPIGARPDPATVPTGDNVVDANFNFAVTCHPVIGANVGNVDILVDITCPDLQAITGNSLYCVVVPIDETNINYKNNFKTGNYRLYLDTLFTGYPLTNDAEKLAAINAINSNTMNTVPKPLENIPILKNVHDKVMFYLLTWSEYDNTEWFAMQNIYTDIVAGSAPVHYPITLTAHIKQKYIS